jgi:hypothetical protein
MSLPRYLLGEHDGIPIALGLIKQKPYSYALTENLTYESAVGGMQGSSGQHSVVSTAVPDGDKGYRYVVQDGRF